MWPDAWLLMFAYGRGQELRNLVMGQLRRRVTQVGQDAFAFLVANFNTNGANAPCPRSPVARGLIEVIDLVPPQRQFIKQGSNHPPAVELVADHRDKNDLPSSDARGELLSDGPNSLANVPIVWGAAHAHTAPIVRPANIWFARKELGDPFVCRNILNEGLPSVSYRYDGVPRTVNQELIGNLVERADFPASLLRDQSISDLDGDAVTGE